jgi:hypothetical protein
LDLKYERVVGLAVETPVQPPVAPDGIRGAPASKATMLQLLILIEWLDRKSSGKNVRGHVASPLTDFWQ